MTLKPCIQKGGPWMKENIQKAVVLVITCFTTIVELIKVIATNDERGEKNGSSS